MIKERKKYVGEYNDTRYWERIKRNLGWMGNTEQEQKTRQEKLRSVVIGIAGCGGIGGAVAERLVRLGVRNLKVADPDTFELSNINRQLGAVIDNIGRNKAEIVAEMVYNITRDINIEVYADGINAENADEFMDGCDYVMDKIEFYNIPARYALHRAFRKSKRCKFMLCTPVIGHRVFVFKYTHDSMPVEEVFGLPDELVITSDKAQRLMERFIPEMPSYPDKEILHNWFIDKKTCPIFAGCPPLAQGILVERLALAITGLDQLPNAAQLPVQPGYAMFDALTWEAKLVRGAWWS
ncbi:MAG: molybdopterin biosynthesis protein MoeB [Gammaproteobacteria bacterium RIFCSPLOWO2_02_FULL_38_11]|nr:MAG: molybdopterin biosynthesis protein MoeB [Gammaproteobacteria bacterium RIFCSPHIGHO2_02_FULL_38_33]OGT23699.1 MAG: molybdopterin biosynthesis protein MoeB [Gammaproteobacteria bacterium RIFCSPHIGHO2_12_38_15]OGT68725.1 MAG: molybdopterin biosynthesis protein MoeB [Gammaproteobacteria bacterium RIFCSPLOWO2_02_FULL_38_11]OGT77694.1 MAG: molybdopterin biosynthesis protein MoeB [Gammaproteobacteria bacterium RIFCSPLOWO2_12_FULL_38_14]